MCAVKVVKTLIKTVFVVHNTTKLTEAQKNKLKKYFTVYQHILQQKLSGVLKNMLISTLEVGRSTLFFVDVG